MKFSCAGVCLPDFCVALGDYQDDDAKTGLLPIPGKAQSLDRKGGGAQSSAEQWEGSFSWTLVVKFCTCKPQTPVSLIFNMYLFKYKPQCLKLQKGKSQHHCGVKKLLYPKPFSHYWQWELNAGNSSWPPRRRAVIVGTGWRWGYREDGGKNKNPVLHCSLVLNRVMRNVLLHSFLLSSNNLQTVSLVSGTMWCARGTGETCCHGAESQLDETELDVLTNRGKEIGRFCWGG